ncbi:MAG: hypothetical protein ACAI34_25045 [Verrucomicrobium sp.]
MKKLIQEIDLHIVVMGGLIAVLYIGLPSTITFAPGEPRLLPSLAVGLVPLLLLLGPSILTRTNDYRKLGKNALRYCGVNTLVAVIYGIICGLQFFAMPSRAKSDVKRKQSPQVRTASLLQMSVPG